MLQYRQAYLTLAKALISNQAWSSAQVAADYAPTLITIPVGGVFVTTQTLGTIHKDGLGYADDNSDLSTSPLRAGLLAGLTASGVSSLRYAGAMGGIAADLANWQGGLNCTLTKGVEAPASNVATKNNIDTYIPEIAQPLGLHLGYTVNYGTNPPMCTAGGDPVVNGGNLVKYANKTKNYGIKYWEIGNELYNAASSETDLHPSPGNGASYATYESNFYTDMKAIDSTILIGVPVGQGVYSWLTNWTLPAMANAKYDAVAYHNYPIVDPISDGNTLYQDRVASNTMRTRGALWHSRQNS